MIKERMVKWLKEVAEKIDECDEDIRKNKWMAQWKKDVSTILTNPNHSNLIYFTPVYANKSTVS